MNTTISRSINQSITQANPHIDQSINQSINRIRIFHCYPCVRQDKNPWRNLGLESTKTDGWFESQGTCATGNDVSQIIHHSKRPTCSVDVRIPAGMPSRAKWPQSPPPNCAYTVRGCLKRAESTTSSRVKNAKNPDQSWTQEYAKGRWLWTPIPLASPSNPRSFLRNGWGLRCNQTVPKREMRSTLKLFNVPVQESANQNTVKPRYDQIQPSWLDVLRIFRGRNVR